MGPTLAIGDFSRATLLSVKTLRYYHEIGLLVPVEVDPHSGYRRYDEDQIATAQVIARLRGLEMPLEDIQAVLAAPDVDARNALVEQHLARLESQLARTQAAVSALRDLLDGPTEASPIGFRFAPAVEAAAISEVVDVAAALSWMHGAIAELLATLAAQDLVPLGPAGSVIARDLFAEERGLLTIFVPCQPPRPLGRVTATTIPASEMATLVHPGSHANIDRAYGALAAHVTRHELGVDGPSREYYLVGPTDTPDETMWRTEVCWPVFGTRSTVAGA